jgi:dephospho-CoA kinase
MAEKIVLGLTGNIGTGKSLVLRMLQELGATVIDADKLVHLLMRQRGPMVEAIVNEFGKFILDDDGHINRNRLGRVVFGMPDALAKLEAITHPVVRQEILKRVAEATTPIVAIEAIKLFESGLAEQCQSNWVVTAPPEIQLKRLVERRKMAADQAQQRIKAQSPQQEKVAKADVVIDNNGDLAKTWALVKKHYLALLQAKSGTAQPATTESLVTETTDVRETLSPTAEVNVNELTVRRAKRTDLQAMAELIAVGTRGAVDPDLSQMMESRFCRG